MKFCKNLVNIYKLFLIITTSVKYLNPKYSININQTLKVLRTTMGSSLEEEKPCLEPKENWLRSWFPYLRWVPSSPEILKEAEEDILSYVKTPSEGFYVDTGTLNGTPCRIWTRKFSHKDKVMAIEKKNKDIPLVMVHGMGSGLAMFALTLDTLSRHCDVFVLDLPGFGRSSRPSFSTDPLEAELQYTMCLEEWRKKIGIEKMNLLGHSFGGFLTLAYTLRYPEQVQKAIMADAWGIPERPADVAQTYNIPIWVRGLFGILRHFNPLWALRVSGPVGPGILNRMRPDLMRKFSGLIEEENLNIVTKYLYHCNAHNPTGEAAFHSMMTGFAWAKYPMFPRLAEMDKNVPLNFLFGSKSWVSRINGEVFENLGFKSVSVETIPDAGHHVYADQPELFTEAVIRAVSTPTKQS